MSLNLARVEALNKNNYDTWRMQVEALLVKDDLWQYVSGEFVKPVVVEGDAQSLAAEAKWTVQDKKAKSDLILTISPSELKQLKGCETSHETWLKLESIYASKGPARKATLLKQLTLHKMQEHDDMREHLNKFFDVVDKLGEMNVDINADLLSIMLLYSLPSSYENFRCAIETRDNLPEAETLKIKILEESDARRQNDKVGEDTNAMWATEKNKQIRQYTNGKGREHKTSYEHSGNHNNNKINNNIICFRCNKKGHIASKCYSKLPREYQNKRTNNRHAKLVEETFFTAVADTEIDTHSNKKWCLDSGCTTHLCKNKELFQDMMPMNESLNLANKDSANIRAKGKVMVKMINQMDEKIVNLENTLWVPDLRTNLMSVTKIVDKGNEIIFKKNIAMIKGIDGDIKLIANRVGNLYYIKQREKEIAQHVNEKNTKMRLWHERMGHLNKRQLISLLSHVNIDPGIDDNILECKVCALGKQPALPFKSSHEKAMNVLEIIHSDICGPFREPSMGGAKYFCTFIDDNSRYCVVYTLKNKCEVFEKFKEYKQMVENMFERKIKYLQTDNGKEFCNAQFDKFLNDCGIQRRLSVPYTPQQNGVAERKNRTLLDMARCMILNAGLKNYFWAEAIMMANHIRNRSPTDSLNNKIPYEIWFNKKVNINYLRVFGTKTFVVDKTITKSKMDPRSKEGYLVGYSEHTKGYRVYIPQMNKVIISRDVKFMNELNQDNEEISSKDDQEIDNNLLDVEITRNEQSEEILETDEETEGRKRHLPGRPKIVRTGKPGRPKKSYRTRANAEIQTITQVNDNDDEDVFEDAIANYAEINLQEAMESDAKDEWGEAIASELKSLLEKDTWDIVTKPENNNIIKCKIVLSNKLNSQGEIYKRKARLVAQGFNQKKGYDYKYTFAPVARMESFRTLIAIAAQYGLTIHHVDVTSAFLNGKLEEDIYIEVPDFFKETLKYLIKEEKGNIRNKAIKMLNSMEDKNSCCKLKKALYGLKQASRQWNVLLDSKLKAMGLKQNRVEPCIYYIHEKKSLILVLVYVDDILIAGNDIHKINEIKRKLSIEFEIKDMGEARYFLGIEIIRNKNEINIIQRRYIKDLLKRFNMENAKGVDTPGNINEKYELNYDTYEAPYRELIGGLMYLAVVTRPDIMNRVVYLAQFMSNPSKAQWKAGKRILRYLLKTMNFGLIYKGDGTSINITGYTDAD